MSKVKYLIHCITRMDYKNMMKIAKKVSKKAKKPFLFILMDMITCGLVYGAGYYDYQEFEFYLLNKKERKTYLTRAKNNAIVKKYNDPQYFDLLDDKAKFNKKFAKYIKREYLIIDGQNQKEFIDFLKKHKEIIVKPVNGEGGKGVEKIFYQKNINFQGIYNTLIENNQTLIEECISQHDEVSKLYPDSVNTLRLFTFYDGTKAHVVNQVFKIGNGGVTDNFSSGSMYTFVDEQGTILVPAIDREDKTYTVHPLTKENILGYQIPDFKKACDLVCEAAQKIPQIKYIGWDVAITKDGPAIIEGNSFPGVFQIKPSFKRGMGLIPTYQKYMDL